MSTSEPSKHNKILITATTFPLNKDDSQPRFILNLAKSLSDYFDTLVLVPRGRGGSSSETIEGVKVKRYPYFFKSLENLVYGGGILENLKKSKLALLQVPFLFVAQFFALCLTIKRENIQLVNAHWIIPQGVIALLAKKIFFKNLKVVVTSHGADLFSLQGRLFNRIKKWVIESSDSFIVVSSAMKAFCYENIGVNKNKSIYVRSMGVDLENKFTFQVPLEERKGLVFVGRLAEKKGVHVLIDAIAILQEKTKDVALTIIGDGPEYQSLLNKCKELNVESNVKFLGAKKNDEIPALLNQHSIFVMPSIVSKSGDQEGLGLVAVEALGCGCAVVASDLPAIRDVIVNQRNGLMFKVGSANDLSEKLLFLLTNPEEIKKLSSAGLLSAKDKFDWEKVGDEYQSILKYAMVNESRSD